MSARSAIAIGFAVTLVAATASPALAERHHGSGPGWGGAAAVGAIAGFVLGSTLGAVATPYPVYRVAPPPPPVYVPPPVVYAPPPVYYAPPPPVVYAPPPTYYYYYPRY